MNVMEQTMREVMERGALSLTAATAKERTQAVVQQGSDKLLLRVLEEIEKAIEKGAFSIAMDMRETPANVCRCTIGTLKEKGFVTDVNGAILKVSWGSMDDV